MPYEMWYVYKPNVSYLKVFGSKFYILKESRKGKFDVKSDERIFLRYSYKIKAYKCLNLSTHKVIESTFVRIDEFAERSEEESCKELEDYRRFIYYELDTLPFTFEGNRASPLESSKSPLATELQLVQPKLQLEATELVQIES